MSHADDGVLNAYLDGELTPVERARLEAHLAECAACRQRLEEERTLIERASGVLGLARPAERPAPPLEHLRRPSSPAGWRVRTPLAWAATVVLALGLGYYVGAMDSVPGAAPREERVASLFDSVRVAEPSFDSVRVAESSEAPVADRLELSARRSVARAVERQDSVAKVTAAPSVVAVDGAPARLREAAPEPVPAAPVVALRDAPSELARGRLVTTEWPIIRREPARRLLGAEPMGVPGLAVKELRLSPAGDGVVLVEQALDSGRVIQLFQRRAEDEVRAMYYAAPPAVERDLRRATNERLARFVGSLRVEIAGPLPPDSLNKLLERVKPIP